MAKGLAVSMRVYDSGRSVGDKEPVGRVRLETLNTDPGAPRGELNLTSIPKADFAVLKDLEPGDTVTVTITVDSSR